jgi:hypothetical protein
MCGQQMAITTPGKPAPDPTSSNCKPRAFSSDPRLSNNGIDCACSDLDHRQAVEQVVCQHLVRISYGSQVIDFGPLLNQAKEIQQTGDSVRR